MFVTNPDEYRESCVDFLRSIAEEATPPKVADWHGLDRASLTPFIAFGLLTVDDVSDEMALTTAGRKFAGLRPEGVPDLAVEKVREITGNITEAELAARYIESKIAGCERLRRDAPSESAKVDLDRIALALSEIANEFRIGMHLPQLVIAGRVIPYNEDNDTGLRHAEGLLAFFQDVHERNVRAGWWTDIHTGEPAVRNVGEMITLMHSELSEAYEGYRKNRMDDHLPDYPQIGVELGDALIRIADFCGALLAGRIVQNDGKSFLDVMSVAEMVDAKLAFNASRLDHKIEERLKADGKKT